MLILILMFSGLLHAQSSQGLESTFSSLPDDPAKEFLRPLTDAFGANLNTGWINNAVSPTEKSLDFQIGVVGMGAFIDPDEAIFQLLDIIFPFKEADAEQLAQSISGFNNLDAATQQAIIREIETTGLMGSVEGPTFFGSEDESVVVTTQTQMITVDGNSYTVPGQQIVLEEVQGIISDPGIFPTVAPQLCLGTLYGTQLTLRFLPGLELSEDVGKLNYFGIGLQHNPLVWLDQEFPVNVALAFFYQRLKIGDALDTKTTAYGLTVSKTFGAALTNITPYGGFLIEKANMDVNYEYEIAPGFTIPFDFEIEGANEFRGVLGVGAYLFGVNIFADYNFSTVNTVNLTLMFGF